MKVISYVVAFDSGLAPNPFFGACTLTVCKPVIRRTAHVGDWVLGFGSTKVVGQDRLIYAMRVDEVLPLEIYGVDRRFRRKRPARSTEIRQVGDCVYWRGSDGEWRQRPGLHGPADMARDLSGYKSLISRRYWYFGAEAPVLPNRFGHLVKRGRGHRIVRDMRLVAAFVRWLEGLGKPGRRGMPWMLQAGCGGRRTGGC